MLPVTDLMIRGKSDGQLPVLVLLHVFGGSRREWIEAGVMLASRYRVISIDSPGFGEASEVEGYSVEEMAESFAASLAGLKVERFALVGHSMTCKVAAVLASRGLPGLEKLVLLTPSPVTPEPMAAADRATMLAQAVPTRADAEQYIRANSSLPIKDDVFARAVEDRMRANPAAWRAWLEHGSEEDWGVRVGELAVPTLVIAAEKDKSLGPEVQRRVTMPRLRNGVMEVVPGCGHMVPLEAPEKLAGLIGEFAGLNVVQLLRRHSLMSAKGW